MNNKFCLDKRKYRIESDGVIVYRVRALCDICTTSGVVKKGEYGGFMEKMDNMSSIRSCWIFGDTVVRDNAYVCGDAVVVDSKVDKNATISDFGIVANSYVTDNAVISGETAVLGSLVCDNAVVSGATRLYKSHVTKDACVFETNCLEEVVIDRCIGSFVMREKSEYSRRTYKYTLLPLSGEMEGLFRLQANHELVNQCANTKSRVIPAGTLGGIVSGVQNLSRYGNCWIDYDAMVLGDASVHDYAFITGKSVLTGNAVACGSSLIVDSDLCGNAYVAGRAKLTNVTVGGISRVFGSAKFSTETNEQKGIFSGRYTFNRTSVANDECFETLGEYVAERK